MNKSSIYAKAMLEINNKRNEDKTVELSKEALSIKFAVKQAALKDMPIADQIDVLLAMSNQQCPLN